MNTADEYEQRIRSRRPDAIKGLLSSFDGQQDILVAALDIVQATEPYLHADMENRYADDDMTRVYEIAGYIQENRVAAKSLRAVALTYDLPMDVAYMES